MNSQSFPGAPDPLAFYKSIIDASPDIITRWSRELELVFANAAFEKQTGLSNTELLGKKIWDAGVDQQVLSSFMAAITRVIENGVQEEYHNVLTVPAGTKYYHTLLVPEKDETGRVETILCVTRDVTSIKINEALLDTTVAEAPVAIALYTGREIKITIANDIMIGYWGKDRSVIGRSLAEAVPELAGQQFLDLLDHVYTTGETVQSHGQPAMLVVEGAPKVSYFDFIYKPIRNPEGEIYAISHMALDVTDELAALQKSKEAELNLRAAVDLAELGTWELDVATQEVTFSPRLRYWFGFGEDDPIMLDRVDAVLMEEDLPRVKAIMASALDPDFDGRFFAEYTLNPEKAGIKRILAVQGRTLFNAERKAYKMTGTVQDVTRQRLVELSLQELVQQRTEELEAANEELSAINEELESTVDELATTNKELVKSNQQLVRSNDNLQQFSYIASHDLQEPLRKIQSFGNLLENRYGDKLADGLDYLKRMRAAAGRMSVLIEDLLSFSRISNNETNMTRISVNSVMHQVVADLELSIQEADAEVVFQGLPAILGDQLQLMQLFTNLISNAIKFRVEGRKPEIRITSTLVDVRQLPSNVQPALAAPKYQRIDVTDNGIGFDPQYAYRIFQVFQRLHGKSEFAGTGIGLAICDKVAANHGGAITANSQPNVGSTFSVYFPN